MKYQRSFTLLETIVAIYVLLAGIVGAMNLAQQNIGAITLFRHQLIAANLAQEGAELVRSRRDSNYLACQRDFTIPLCYDSDPSDGLSSGSSFNPNVWFMNGIAISDATGGGCATPNGCYVNNLQGDINGLIQFTQCPAGGCPYLKLDPATGFYQYSDGTDTIFTREILLTELPTIRDSGLHDWEVVSKVSWREKLVDKSVEVVDVLTPHGHR